MTDRPPPGPMGTAPVAEFTVVSRRTVQIDRADLCNDCQKRFDLIEAKLIFGTDDYPCEDCRAKILARERGFAADESIVTPSVRRG